ncbi:histone deacetylase [Kitasatospora arboriphila]|uniref:Histone deacetylase n=1 Tax=Kitasatospora arboriphila TaxID=258052 RepID=A0ABN1U5Z3_9ACTN
MGTPVPRRPRPHPVRPPELLDPAGPVDPADPVDRARPVWYAAYGSNMRRARLHAYLAGGSPPGTARRYPGCRDPRPPAADLPLLLPGRLYFARESLVWGGGIAFLDAEDDGELPARGYLLTLDQLLDIAAQEMHRAPRIRAAPGLAAALRDGRATLGPGHYETLLCPGTLDGHPVLTFTAAGRSSEAPLTRPSAGYLRHLATGLAESHGWPARRAAAYLSTRPGAAGRWTPDSLLTALRSRSEQ